MMKSRGFGGKFAFFFLVEKKLVGSLVWAWQPVFFPTKRDWNFFSLVCLHISN